MANPFYLAARGFEITADLFRMGKSLNIGEKLTSAAQKFNSVDRAAGTARGAAVGASVFGAKWGAKAKVFGEELAIRGKNLWGERAPGLQRSAKNTYNFLRHDPVGQRAAIVGGSAALGYMTSPGDATRGEKFGRAVGFGIAGGYGYQRFSNPKNVKHLSGVMRGLATKRFGVAGAAFNKAFGMPEKWGIKHSMGAGAMYGLLSTHTSIAEGAIFGGVADVGMRGITGNGGLRGAWSKSPEEMLTGKWMTGNKIGRLGELNEIRKAEGLRSAFRAAPLIRSMALAGGIRGAYNNMGTGDMTGLNVLGGALGGAAKGAALGVGARMVASHPFVTVGVAGPSLKVLGDAVTAAGTVAQAGAPGFDTMNADGDLALSLHRMRHG